MYFHDNHIIWTSTKSLRHLLLHCSTQGDETWYAYVLHHFHEDNRHFQYSCLGEVYSHYNHNDTQWYTVYSQPGVLLLPSLHKMQTHLKEQLTAIHTRQQLYGLCRRLGECPHAYLTMTYMPWCSSPWAQYRKKTFWLVPNKIYFRQMSRRGTHNKLCSSTPTSVNNLYR